MSFTLPSLNYEVGSLEPHIDARTMEIHHGKHHAAYISNLNKALEELLADQCALVPEPIRVAVRNNGGGHWNHSLFWKLLSPRAPGRPVGQLASALVEAFGSFEAFQEKFSAAGMGRFGSGWAWLVKETSGALNVYSTANQDCPLMEGKTPVLGLDVWEHAYYLNYQNRRADYIQAWWNVVDWEAANALFVG